MKTICLYFEIHQIIHLKRYRCFDIGRDHYYYDDYENERGISDIAERSYIPALSALIEMAKNHGDTFKVALSISGVALEQLEVHAPGVIELLHQLNETGCCEFCANLILTVFPHWLMKIVSAKKWNVCVPRLNKYLARSRRYSVTPA